MTSPLGAVTQRPPVDSAPPTIEAPIGPPPPPPTTGELVARVKGAEGERDARRLNAFIAKQTKEETLSLRDIGLCKTTISGSVSGIAAAVTALVTRNPWAAAGAGAAGKMVGDGVAALACDPGAK